jgi:DNA-binding transcriptional MerR regulator
MKTATRSGRLYRVREFAELSGVTVRALHHYDRLGLLTPLRSTRTGYRAYRDSDFARLEQIVVLKFLGLPLSDIARLVRKPSSLKDALAAQRRVLHEKRARLDRAIDAIDTAERSLALMDEPEWELFKLIVKRFAMDNTTDWTKQYYSEAAAAKVDSRRALWSPELQERVTKAWTDIYAEVDAAMARGETPDSAAARDIAIRARALLREFTGGDPEIQQGLNRMWADRVNWPSGPAKSFPFKAEVTEFVRQAIARLS